MTAFTRIQTAVGVVGAALLVSLVFVPGVVPLPQSPTGLDLPSTDGISYAVAAVLGLATLLVALFSQTPKSTTETAAGSLVAGRPEEIHGRATGYPRPDVDASFEGLVDEDDDAAAFLSTEFRETAIGLYAAETACSRDDAAAAIDAGEWTADRRAAAFVARDSDPLPLRSRLWDYVRAEHADHRRARHAAEALESLAAGEGTAETAGDDR